jgi:CBS domain-containing protein
MSILRIAKVPAAAVPPSATVMEAVRKMKDNDIGAVAVLDDGILRGMFSERDVMLRIVLETKNPAKTTVKDVMTTDVIAIRKDTQTDEAVKLMWERHIRHLPVFVKMAKSKESWRFEIYFTKDSKI